MSGEKHYAQQIKSMLNKYEFHSKGQDIDFNIRKDVDVVFRSKRGSHYLTISYKVDFTEVLCYGPSYEEEFFNPKKIKIQSPAGLDILEEHLKITKDL